MTTQTRATMRPYAGEADLPAILDLLNTCDALDQLDDNYSLDSLRRRLDEPPVDQAHDLRLWEDATGRLAGFGQLWYAPLSPADEVIDGEIYFRVHPGLRNQGLEDEIIAWGAGRGYRKIGLGRAMLLAGMHRLKAAGVDTAVLGVDAENPTGALRLYESVGFTPVVTNVSYRKDL